MRLYVLGGEGQVARALREAATSDPAIVFRHGTRPEVDLLKPESIERAIADFRPDIVVNPAAYTAVDKAESEPDEAFAVNREGAHIVAAAAARQNAPIIHLSTDYVFDGNKQTPYVEDDIVAPQGVYGRSKLEGEQAVAAANPRHIVLRTSWVYAPFGSNFVRIMLNLAAERDRLRVVDDQVGCPTYAPDLAQGILSIARTLVSSGWKPDYRGITNLAGPDAMSWCSFARMILQGAADRGGRLVQVDAITTAEYGSFAARPANSRLSTAKCKNLFGVSLPPAADALARCLDQLLKS